MTERQVDESVVGWTWSCFIDAYPWTEGGTALKAWRTKEEAEADARKEWGDDVDATLIPLRLIDGPDA